MYSIIRIGKKNRFGLGSLGVSGKGAVILGGMFRVRLTEKRYLSEDWKKYKI